MSLIRNLTLAIVAGALLHLSVALQPVWWAVWLAPLPLLWLGFSNAGWRSRAWTGLAILIGTSAYLPYFRLVMPLPAVFLAWLGQSLLWWFVVMTTRRIVLAGSTVWTIFAYPVLWTAVDTLMAALLPDGNWGSLAYSQADVLPLLQSTSLFGVSGLLFLLCLPASAVAVVCWHRRVPHHAIAGTAVIVLVLGAIGFGEWRLRQPLAGDRVRVGVASIDDAIGIKASPDYANNIRARYDALVAKLAASGAHVVVLPEKIAMLAPQAATQWQAHFGEVAARDKVWLEVGIGIDDGKHPRNYAWLFDPSGQRVEDYEKHYMAPPERAKNYASGNAWNVHRIDGRNYGLAVCKDMHFAALGREYGRRAADVMLVPAWDFAYVDGWMASRMTVVRGVENGYGVVRAAREGLLTISDAHGRVLAETRSAPMPGNMLLADLPIGPRAPTLYARVGNLFGWLCVALAAMLVAFGRVPWARRS